MRILLCIISLTFSSTLGNAVDELSNPFVVVLGIAQDAGYPHAGCKKECCIEAVRNPSKKRLVSSLALVDPATDERWIFDVTPDFIHQMHLLDQIHPVTEIPVDRRAPLAHTLGISGLFLTHAHIGHYTGLMYFGKESIGSLEVPVYVMPRMREFLKQNGPWSQLVDLGNIGLIPLQHNVQIQLNNRLSVTPFLVPHRDEFSETVGYLIEGPNKSLLFLPDIDKWEQWEIRIEDMLSRVDVAYLDGSFYAAGEVPGRDMKAIPHPFIVETMERFRSLPRSEKSKVRFIHFNHTNPVLDSESKERQSVLEAGFEIAEQGERISL